MVTYKVKFTGYCGMSSVPQEFDEEKDARNYVARLLRRRRASGHPIYPQEQGREWEIGEPEDCMLVPDTAGMLRLVEDFTCDSCGAPLKADDFTLCERCEDDEARVLMERDELFDEEDEHA